MADAWEIFFVFVTLSSSSAAEISEISELSPSPSAARHSSHSRVAARHRAASNRNRGAFFLTAGTSRAGTSPPSTRPAPRITVSARRWCFPAKSAWQYRNRSSGSFASPSPLMLTSLSAKNTAESSRCFSRQSRTTERSFSSVARGTRGASGGASMVPARAHGRSGARSREDEIFPDGTT